MVMDLTYNPDVLKAYDPMNLVWDEQERVLRNVLTNEVASTRPLPSLAQYMDAFGNTKRLAAVGLRKLTGSEYDILLFMITSGDSRRQYRWTAMKMPKLATSLAFETDTDETHIKRALRSLEASQFIYRSTDQKGREFAQFDHGLYDMVLECAWRWLIREAASAWFMKAEVKRLDQSEIARRVDVRFRERVVNDLPFSNAGRAEDRAMVVAEVLREMVVGR
jgi:DNA-binding MarR family transcriptional regulator